MIIAQIFTALQVLLKLFGLWEQFQNFMSAVAIKEAEERARALDQALKDAQNAKTPDDAWKAQEGVTKNEP